MRKSERIRKREIDRMWKRLRKRKNEKNEESKKSWR